MHWLFEQARDWAVRRCWTHGWPTTSSACRTGGTRAFRRRQSSCCVLESRTPRQRPTSFSTVDDANKDVAQVSSSKFGRAFVFFSLLFQIKKGKQVPLCRPGSPSCCEGAAAASTRARCWRSFVTAHGVFCYSSHVAGPARPLAARRRRPHTLRVRASTRSLGVQERKQTVAGARPSGVCGTSELLDGEASSRPDHVPQATRHWCAC